MGKNKVEKREFYPGGLLNFVVGTFKENSTTITTPDGIKETGYGDTQKKADERAYEKVRTERLKRA